MEKILILKPIMMDCIFLRSQSTFNSVENLFQLSLKTMFVPLIKETSIKKTFILAILTFQP